MGRPFKKDISSELLMLLERIGKNIAYYRAERSMSQAELARKSGISATTLNEIETFKPRDMRLSTLYSIARALGIAPVQLMSDADLDLSAKDHATLLKASEAIFRITKKLR
ncbi:MAG: helix-turn-helix transcriptional regulator [Deltaproteobacteria bacterium]|nr:helix-turn-helix transcriptional regulator [Deltaproteobacteria bacterium]